MGSRHNFRPKNRRKCQNDLKFHAPRGEMALMPMTKTTTEYVKTRDRIKSTTRIYFAFLPIWFVAMIFLSWNFGAFGGIISAISALLVTFWCLYHTRDIPKTATMMMTDAEFIPLLPQELKCEKCGSALISKSGIFFYDTCKKCGNDNTKSF